MNEWNVKQSNKTNYPITSSDWVLNEARNSFLPWTDRFIQIRARPERSVPKLLLSVYVCPVHPPSRFVLLNLSMSTIICGPCPLSDRLRDGRLQWLWKHTLLPNELQATGDSVKITINQRQQNEMQPTGTKPQAAEVLPFFLWSLTNQRVKLYNPIRMASP